MLPRTRYLQSAVAHTLSLSVSAFYASAQNAQVTGIVTDSQGAAVPHTATLVKVVAQSNGSGVYTVASLVPGNYQITIAAPGFQTRVLESVTVSVAGKLALNSTLQVGSASER